MSFLLGGKKPPKPQRLPMAPTSADNYAAQEARDNAARAAMAESAMGGRRSTIVAGMKIAMAEQQEAGLLSKRRREEAAAL